MTEDPEQKIRKKATSYLKYSGLASQLLGIGGFSFVAGRYLDSKVGFDKPYITILLIIATFSGYMYKLYKELFNEK